MEGFNPKLIITDPDKLFGRKILLNQLEALAARGSNVQLIGVRRFGKTSILKCLEKIILDNPKCSVIPIYIDFKEEAVTVTGTSNVYRYLISRLIQQLSILKILDECFEIKKVKITPSIEWLDVYESLASISDVRIQSVFESIILFFSELTEKTFLFLIDEYEHLFRYSFDTPQGFMKLRNISSKAMTNGRNPMCFYIAGTLPWDYLCSVTGSPELNVIDQTMYVNPIEQEDFHKMIKYECSTIGIEHKNITIEIEKEIDILFNEIGGVPFYAKVIGLDWLTKLKKPGHEILRSFFSEVYDTLRPEEKQILFELANRNNKIIKNILIIRYYTSKFKILKKDSPNLTIANIKLKVWSKSCSFIDI